MLVHMLIEQISIVHFLCVRHIAMAANGKKKSVWPPSRESWGLIDN